MKMRVFVKYPNSDWKLIETTPNEIVAMLNNPEGPTAVRFPRWPDETRGIIFDRATQEFSHNIFEEDEL